MPLAEVTSRIRDAAKTLYNGLPIASLKTFRPTGGEKANVNKLFVGPPSRHCIHVHVHTYVEVVLKYVSAAADGLGGKKTDARKVLPAPVEAGEALPFYQLRREVMEVAEIGLRYSI